MQRGTAWAEVVRRKEGSDRKDGPPMFRDDDDFPPPTVGSNGGPTGGKVGRVMMGSGERVVILRKGGAGGPEARLGRREREEQVGESEEEREGELYGPVTARSTVMNRREPDSNYHSTRIP